MKITWTQGLLIALVVTQVPQALISGGNVVEKARWELISLQRRFSEAREKSRESSERLKKWELAVKQNCTEAKMARRTREVLNQLQENAELKNREYEKYLANGPPKSGFYFDHPSKHPVVNGRVVIPSDFLTFTVKDCLDQANASKPNWDHYIPVYDREKLNW